jgi:hypothetical protein
MNEAKVQYVATRVKRHLDVNQIRNIHGVLYPELPEDKRQR